MKNSHLVILGILVIIVSLFTGPLGILISLTGLGVPPIWLQFLLIALAVIALLGFKQVLRRGYKYYDADKPLHIFLWLTVINFFVRNFHQALLVNKPLQFIVLLIFVITPISALLFYISILKAKKFWVSFYGVIGILISLVGIIEQMTVLGLVYFLEPSKYANIVVIGKMAGGALVSYIKMLQNWLLGGILIWGGFIKVKRSDKNRS